MDALLENEKIAAVIKRLLKNEHTELSVGIIRGDTVKTFEYRKSADPYYDIGSISKVFTSLMILKASREGLIRLSDTIDAYLPLTGKRFPTVDGLLKHRTGYTGFTPWRIVLPRILRGFARRNIYRGVTKEQVLSSIRKIGYKGDRYGYSDFSYAVLGMILESVYREPYGVLLEQFVREEFGLNGIKAIDGEWKRKNNYIRNKQIKNWSWEGENPYVAAGGITVTVDDMLAFMNALIESDKAYVSDAFAVEEEIGKHNRTFFLSKNRHVYSHIGGVGTFRGCLSINRKQKIGVLVLSTSAGYQKGNVSYLNKMVYNALRRKKIEL